MGRLTQVPTLRILGLTAAIAVTVALLASACRPSRPHLVTLGGPDPADDTGEPNGAGRVIERPILAITPGADEVVDQTGQAREAAASSSRARVDGDPVPSLIGPSGSPLPTVPASTTEVPLVVFDTDMGPDIDDALALAMLHAYQDRGQAEIAAVTLSRNSVDGVRFIDAVNTWYGHPDIPLGLDPRSPYDFNDATSYVVLADRWPNDAGSNPVDDGVTVLRRTLARAIDEGRRPIVIQVGFSGNTAALLDSGPDGISSLSGPELVTESGALLSIMAGSIGRERVEFNVANDVAAARRVLTGWPGDLVLSPFELGWDLHYPYDAIRARMPGDGSHLIRVAYEHRDYSWHADAPPLYDMRSWDLSSVMHAIEPQVGWFPVSDWGVVTIDGEGRTDFVAGQGRHRILVRDAMSANDLARAQQAMIDLVSATPR